MESQIAEFVQGLAAKFPIVGLILIILGLLVVIASVIVGLTATKKDDLYLAKAESNPLLGPVLKVLIAFSPVQPKRLAAVPQPEAPKAE